MNTKNPVNNTIYREAGHTWWDEDSSSASLRYMVNPVRFGYFARILSEQCEGRQTPRRVLDVGCGGGILAEEFAKADFEVTGVDPAPESIACARSHAATGGLAIDYSEQSGEALQFADDTFDVVTCCDVLEHVDDVARVIGEIARVLKPGGLFLYDTINRTVASWFVVIKVAQEWRSTAFNERGTHVWRRFITPAELVAMMAGQGLVNREIRGMAPSTGAISGWLNLRRRARGRISYLELAQRMKMKESEDTACSYMGYAVKA